MGNFWEGFRNSWGLLRAPFIMLVLGMVFKRALGGFWARFWFDFRGFGMDFGRVWEGFGRDFRGFWLILGYSGLFWILGTRMADLRKILAGAPCCLLLLCWSLRSKSVLAFACCCLLGHAFAPSSI